MNKSLKRISYWLESVSIYLTPHWCYRALVKWRLRHLSAAERAQAQERAAYYARLSDNCRTRFSTSVGSFKFPYWAKHHFSMYFFDLHKAVFAFDKRLKFNYIFRDVTWEAPVAAFVKSRPLGNSHTHSVVMKLDSLRHFRFVQDPIPWSSKKDMLVSRNFVTQPHRRLLLERYIDHPMCNIGKTNTESPEPHPEWVKDYMSLDEQLQYKFIACIEGNDVATNLKWVMSSNSLAVMPRPRFETWFMEGTLQPGVHYVEVKRDYSDLIDQMQYYLAHPDEAERIIANAHAYVAQFQNKRLELATQLATAQLYFERTHQL